MTAGAAGSGSATPGANATAGANLSGASSGAGLPDTTAGGTIDASLSGATVKASLPDGTAAGGAVGHSLDPAAPAAEVVVDAFYGAASTEGTANLSAGLTPSGGSGQLPGTVVGDLFGDTLPGVPALSGSSADTFLTADIIAPAVPVSGSLFASAIAMVAALPVVGDAVASAIACVTINAGACGESDGTSPIPGRNADGSLIADVTSDAVPASGSLIGSAAAFFQGLPVIGDALASGFICATINASACEAPDGSEPPPGIDASGSLVADVTSDAVPASGSVIGSGDALAEDLPLVGNAAGTAFICITINSSRLC